MSQESQDLLFPLGKSVDSRLKGYNGQVTHSALPFERTFCANCGKEKGWVSRDQGDYIRAAGIIVICDECDKTLGKLPLQEALIQEVKL